MKNVKIYTDGACKGNPGKGGWGAILIYGDVCRELKGYEAQTTNNRMELKGAIEALSTLKEPCEVDMTSDSQYLSKGVTEWMFNWKKNGWRTTAKKPVMNQDLWMKLDSVIQMHKIKWHWVKGHAGHPENERCDELANIAISEGC
ncbi:MAG: ribonuclease HI [Fibrobacteres bacterium]|nr:ribonuclease HI [Fibrobacterota bacterium]